MEKQANSSILLMPHGAHPHAAKATIRAMDALGIEHIEWPPFSSHLNQIECV